MSTQAVTPDVNANPFDTPLPSEVNEHQQAVAASPTGNPFDEPLPSEKADSQRDAALQKQPYDGSKMGSKVPNSILNGPDSTGEAIGGLTIGGGAALLAGEATAPALRYIGSEWGAPAVKALQQAAEAHPIVAKVIAHGLTDAGLMGLAKYMKIFGKP